MIVVLSIALFQIVFATKQCYPSVDIPKSYVAHRLSSQESIVIDGHINELAWQQVPFTENFVDISTSIEPKYVTKAKIRWDETFLYIAGFVQGPNIFANQTKHNSVVFKDNDFEVFIDPDQSTHGCKLFSIVFVCFSHLIFQTKNSKSTPSTPRGLCG